MSGFSIFKIFQIFGIVSNWAAKALADGKITLVEAVELATLIAEILNVKIEVEVPTSVMDIGQDEILTENPMFDLSRHPPEPNPKPIED